MSVDFGWRRFNFFDKQIVFDPEKPDEKFLGLKDVCVECWCAQGDYAYLGETRGGVFRLHKRLHQFFWKAYQHKLSALHTARNFLFSLGEDEEGDSVLKIWDLDKIDESSVRAVREIRMQSIVASSSVCCLAVHSTLTGTVIGCEDGSVFLYSGDITRDKNVGKWLRVRDAALDGPITGLAISQVHQFRSLIFVITGKSLFSVIVDNKTVTSKNKHESMGASKDCWTFDEKSARLIVGSKDASCFVLLCFLKTTSY
ncbi:hypothetical protein WR25_10963 [Diploscapter pachys]|uniref:PEP5/VPS11 N-terminal domain-containing protein n=1 Tax=Diploscapter pachys TaxID=2018661 RepID=A0A2A2LYA7_9BILA|nr:hypothetical protein WR25_10963 [Diploscapter pachys]